MNAIYPDNIEGLNSFQSKALFIEIDKVVNCYELDFKFTKYDFIFYVPQLNIKLFIEFHNINFHILESGVLSESEYFNWLLKYVNEIKIRIGSGEDFISDLFHHDADIDNPGLRSFNYLTWDIVNKKF